MLLPVTDDSGYVNPAALVVLLESPTFGEEATACREPGLPVPVLLVPCTSVCVAVISGPDVSGHTATTSAMSATMPAAALKGADRPWRRAFFYAATPRLVQTHRVGMTALLQPRRSGGSERADCFRQKKGRP